MAKPLEFFLVLRRMLVNFQIRERSDGVTCLAKKQLCHPNKKHETSRDMSRKRTNLTSRARPILTSCKTSRNVLEISHGAKSF